MRAWTRLPDGRGAMTLPGDRRYVWLPVGASDVKEELLCAGKEGVRWRLMTPSWDAPEAFRYYSAIETGGGPVTLTGRFPDAFFDAIRTADERPGPVDAHPAIHFAAENGWINDPNGLVAQDGEFHLFFQHNPVDMVWENMSWGHAVSRDLLHWTQLDNAMYPDENGTMFSGSGLENRQGALGLPSNALLFFYTCAGDTSAWSRSKRATQRIAYSLDGGRTLVKRPAPAVEHMIGLNRDPKVYWYAPKRLYYMALYLTGDEFAILNSADLSDFQVTQRLTMPGSGECPDLRAIPREGGGERWMLMEADGHYLLGDFDGSRFTAASPLQRAYCTELPYAAQTVSGPEDRVILIPWMRTKNPRCAYTGMMGLPRELTLACVNGEDRLRLRPVREYWNARRPTQRLTYAFDQHRAVEAEVSLEGAARAEITVGQIAIVYDRTAGRLTVGGEAVDFPAGLPGLRVLIDKGILEISSSDDLWLAPFEADEAMEEGEITARGEGVKADFYEIPG